MHFLCVDTVTVAQALIIRTRMLVQVLAKKTNDLACVAGFCTVSRTFGPKIMGESNFICRLRPSRCKRETIAYVKRQRGQLTHIRADGSQTSARVRRFLQLSRTPFVARFQGYDDGRNWVNRVSVIVGTSRWALSIMEGGLFSCTSTPSGIRDGWR